MLSKNPVSQDAIEACLDESDSQKALCDRALDLRLGWYGSDASYFPHLLMLSLTVFIEFV